VKTVLTPIDFSRVTDAVVEEAATLAQAFGGRVVLLAVTQSPATLAEYMPMADNVGEIAAAAERNAARELAKQEAALAARGVDTESMQLTGLPVTHILQQAESLSADYIVMGSHGHKALYELLVGSTTHGVLLRAKCPVIIVPTARVETAKTKEERFAVA
jgi:nucleotide-binding universal stress UspA family protein